MKGNSILNDPRFRAGLFQVIILSLVIYFAYVIFNNTVDNMERRGITSGFSFLKSPAGFDIDMHLIPFESSDSNLRVFWVGLLNTLLVSFLAIVFSTFLGTVIGVSRLSKNWLIAKFATVYIEIFRNTPLLLQIFFWYFVVLRSLPNVRQSAENGLFGDAIFIHNRGISIPKPIFEQGFLWVLLVFVVSLVACLIYRYNANQHQQKTAQSQPTFVISAAILVLPSVIAFFTLGLPMQLELPALKGFNFAGGVTILPEFLAMLFSLTIYSAAFIAENVRSGIMSVNKGQTEAAYSLSLKSSQTLRFIVLPQAMRVIIPPLASQYLNIAKNSSLAAAIAYPELVSIFAGTVLNTTGQALECILMAMIAYLTISLSIAAFMNWYNKKMALIER